MLNRCEFIGNLGRDPEVRTFQNGGKVCNLRLACTEKWKDQEGRPQERTEWVSVAIFSEGLARVAEQYLRKGSRAYVAGKLVTRKWQDQSGQDRYSTEIELRGPDSKLVLLDARRDDGGQQGHSPQGGGGGAAIDDEIPWAPEWRL